MTQEQFEKASSILTEMHKIDEALMHLKSSNGLYGITVQANNCDEWCFISDVVYLQEIQPYLIGFFDDRKTELEKEFKQL